MENTARAASPDPRRLAVHTRLDAPPRLGRPWIPKRITPRERRRLYRWCVLPALLARGAGYALDALMVAVGVAAVVALAALVGAP